MARKMDFSVVGLPHYTIWHLYEPSVDDVKHMEVRFSHLCCHGNLLIWIQEMEQEKLAKEKEEMEQAEKEKKVKEGYGLDESSSQWEKDKDVISNMAKEQREQAEEESTDSVDSSTKPKQSKLAQEAGKPSDKDTGDLKKDADDLRKKQL